jgi:hypothetical protein
MTIHLYQTPQPGIPKADVDLVNAAFEMLTMFDEADVCWLDDCHEMLVKLEDALLEHRRQHPQVWQNAHPACQAEMAERAWQETLRNNREEQP